MPESQPGPRIHITHLRERGKAADMLGLSDQAVRRDWTGARSRLAQQVG